jgi:hypothetical protein
MVEREIELIARRVAELVAEAEPQFKVVDARKLAEILGVSRSVVYANAERLGPIRLGNGPKVRLRFIIDNDTPKRSRGEVQRAEYNVPAPQAMRRVTAQSDLLPVQGRGPIDWEAMRRGRPAGEGRDNGSAGFGLRRRADHQRRFGHLQRSLPGQR